MKKAVSFDRLAACAHLCFTCTEMDYVHVLGQANGSPRAQVMFIGEAPGRLGAVRTGVPFTRDQSGQRFERLLRAAGLNREDVFVTNAVLCNPLRDGKNRPPRRSEIAACSRWLKAQVDLVQPRIVVTLGAMALVGTRMIERHDFELRRDVARPLRWNSRTLVPLYHPSPRTVGRRTWRQQLEDWQRLGQVIGGRGAAQP